MKIMLAGLENMGRASGRRDKMLAIGKAGSRGFWMEPERETLKKLILYSGERRNKKLLHRKLRHAG
jgi:hypothetical protein